MAIHESTPATARAGTLTSEQIEIAMSEVARRLAALERVSILLQVDGLEDARAVDALHTLTQSVLQSTGHLVEAVAMRCGASSSMLPNCADPMLWYMPPLFFPRSAVSSAEEKA